MPKDFFGSLFYMKLHTLLYIAIVNNLQNLHALKNRYYIMRHGQSKANLQQIIISRPDNGTREDYALTELGREQAKSSVTNSPLGKETLIYCSDFSRAKETAGIVQGVLGVSEIHVTQKLRERNFGDWEKSDITNYHKVWELDQDSANHVENNVEAVNEVLDRATSLILDLEKRYSDKDILLVSHGDTLQILQTGFHKIDPTRHRSLTHLEIAEIRELTLVN